MHQEVIKLPQEAEYLIIMLRQQEIVCLHKTGVIQLQLSQEGVIQLQHKVEALIVVEEVRVHRVEEDRIYHFFILQPLIDLLSLSNLNIHFVFMSIKQPHKLH